MQNAVLAIVNLSASASVTLWHCQNKSSCSHAVFTGG